MAWEWSHTEEAYAAGKSNLAKQPISFLLECLAEWKATEWEDESVMQNPQFNALKYDVATVELDTANKENARAGISLKLRKQGLAEEIWKLAEELRTCENGGHEAWVCPYGCHTVAW